MKIHVNRGKSGSIVQIQDNVLQR